jgi:hypothetical protein
MAATPTVTVIDYPGAVGTAIFGINPQGDMVGAWDDTAGNEHGFVFLAPRNPAAAKTTYDTICPGGLDALKNHAAGGGCFVSFDYSTSLTTAVWTDAFGITPQGEIVGQYGAATTRLTASCCGTGSSSRLKRRDGGTRCRRRLRPTE